MNLGRFVFRVKRDNGQASLFSWARGREVVIPPAIEAQAIVTATLLFLGGDVLGFHGVKVHGGGRGSRSIRLDCGRDLLRAEMLLWLGLVMAFGGGGHTVARTLLGLKVLVSCIGSGTGGTERGQSVPLRC